MRALALDLGTTRIKVGVFDEDGFRVTGNVAAPPLHGESGIRISDPEAYLATARTLVRAAGAPPGTPLGITTQRSSFLLWEARTGKPVTPLLSWQDLRARAWCRRNAHLEDHAATGLPLSPHYAATKLALLLEQDVSLHKRAQRGEVLFGTLDSFLLRNWTGGRVHQTDVSMAARTLLVDLDGDDWCAERLRRFGIPRAMLPEIRPTHGCHIETDTGYPVTATIADQPAGALPLFARFPGAAHINSGTGTFIMRFRTSAAPPGYLSALVGNTFLGRPTIFWEGGIHAGALLLSKTPDPIDFYSEEFAVPAGCFAVPDSPGLGAPYRRSDLSLLLSERARRLSPTRRNLAMILFLLFRIRQVIEGLFGSVPPERIMLTGGLAGRSDLPTALAAFLDQPVYLLRETEMGLWGAGWLAAGHGTPPQFDLTPVPVSRSLAHWEPKYRHWKTWLENAVKT